MSLDEVHASKVDRGEPDGGPSPVRTGSPAVSDTTVTFVMAAYNAAETIAQSLDSLLAQTSPDWRVIVVDDGSTDATAAIAEGYAARDERIRVVSQQNGGVSAARNNGLAQIDTTFSAFLDSDDLIDPTFVEKMVGALVAHPDKDVSFCNYRRFTPDGRMLRLVEPPDSLETEPWLALGDLCWTIIHSVVFRTRLIHEVGSFDRSLRTCEDWDLWIRFARNGAGYIGVRECLAFYRKSPGSLTTGLYGMARDLIHVAERVARPDPRCPTPVPGTENGIPRDPVKRSLYAVSWCAAQRAAAGLPVDDIVDLLRELPPMYDEYGGVVASALHALEEALDITDRAELIAASPTWMPCILSMFRLLGERSGHGVERLLVGQLAFRLSEADPFPSGLQVGPVVILLADPARLAHIETDEEVDTVHLWIETARGRRFLGNFPVYGHVDVATQARFIRDRAGNRDVLRHVLPGTSLGSWVKFGRRSGRTVWRNRRWPSVWKRALVWAVQQTLFDEMVRRSDGGDPERASSATAKRIIADAYRWYNDAGVDPSVGAEDPFDRTYWEAHFDTVDPWNYGSPYEQVKYRQTFDLIPEGPVARALEIACAEGIFTRRLAPRVERLVASDISSKALMRAAERCRGQRNVEFRRVDVLKDALPRNLDLIVCSEMLYYLGTVDQLRHVAGKLAGALAEGGTLVAAHAHLLVDEPHRTGFGWKHAFGEATIRKVLSETPGLVLEKVVETELYAVCRFRRVALDATAPEPLVEKADYGKPLDEDTRRWIRWSGLPTLPAEAAAEETDHVPVLMYHRIADDGPEPLKRWRMPPDQFDAQMRHLREAGYHALTSGTLAQHLHERRTLRGKPVIITFDDGYCDFEQAAYPILERYGLVAEVFIVTDRVGGTSDWDDRYGPPFPLMDWQSLYALQSKGIAFGSHLATHRAATSLGSRELLDEAARSRFALEANLDTEIRSIALPFGAHDSRTEWVLADAGYHVNYMAWGGRASIHDNPRKIPRIEAWCDIPLDDFAAALRGDSLPEPP